MIGTVRPSASRLATARGSDAGQDAGLIRETQSIERERRRGEPQAHGSNLRLNEAVGLPMAERNEKRLLRKQRLDATVAGAVRDDVFQLFDDRHRGHSRSIPECHAKLDLSGW